MAPRSILVALAVAISAAWPTSALSATAPGAPHLTTAPYASPAIFQWTPAADLLNVSQTIHRAPGACTTPLATGVAVRTYPGNATNQHFAVPGEGTFCFYVSAADLAGGTANSPGLTITIDTVAPTATVAVSNTAAGGVVIGTVNVSGTSSDAISGVASSVLRIGAVGACAAGTVLRSPWDTTAYTDGAYDICNVVTDRAGHIGIATVTVTVANSGPVPVPMPGPLVPAAATPAAPAASAPAVAAPGGTSADKLAPLAPTKLAIVQPRTHSGAAPIPVTLRWVNPAASDLDRVVVVLNLKHPPRSVADGSVAYRGLGTSTTFELRAGKSAYLALYAYDHSGNVSRPARRAVSLAALIPLRPLTGSVVSAAPRLTWKAKEGTAYYNVQIFRNGRRILVGWPSQPSFLLPAYLLEPGIYTWFVWPAVKHKSATTFADLIGRATFVYEG